MKLRIRWIAHCCMKIWDSSQKKNTKLIYRIYIIIEYFLHDVFIFFEKCHIRKLYFI